jgi:hypothetical protein
MSTDFTAGDREQLAARGVTIEEAERQLELLARPPAPVALVRPCTVGDGIVKIGEVEGRELLQCHADAAERGRVRLFVPASGAATRMFQDLVAVRANPALGTPAAVDDAARAGSGEAKAMRAFLAGIDRFAFFAELKHLAERGGTPLRVLVREGPLAPILDALLGEDGLGFAARPKGLIPFHDYADGPRVPLDEHLLESSQISADADLHCRLHLTVSSEHRAAFEARLAESEPRMRERLDVSFEATFSEQKPSSDTIAADPSGGPFRNGDGRLLFRPAGHGALLENLADLAADLVMVKNVDNVAHDRYKDATFRWSRVLVGLATQLERRAVGLVRRIEADESGALDEAAVFVRDSFHCVPPPPAVNGAAARPEHDRAAWLLDALSRPIRVCGMVPNTGEPGGGPMWVRGSDGAVTPQIVELSQVDMEDSAQRAVVASATHFNPVFMALALRDAHDRPHPLHRFVDPRAVMVAKKSAGGRELLALERPGLWNGAMAGWNTVFVEVPLSVFNPVKTVNDLLRREHQAG